ncbi:helicase-exonuclease AddAB subunit AddA [Bacillota bacterium]
MNWTEEQKQAIEIKDKSILVSAAAGSGKTAVLVERIKQIIQMDRISLDELLVVTFTNAAASEMREKIVSAIPEQMDQIHKAHISTFHSFALDVIRRYFHLINIQPGFKICDETQRILLQNDAMDRLFAEGFGSGREDFIKFLRLYGGSRNEDAVKDMIFEVHRFIQSLPDPIDWLDRSIEFLAEDPEAFISSPIYEELLDNIREDVSRAVSDLKTVLEIVSSGNINSLIPKAKADLETAEQIARSFERDFDTGRQVLSGVAFQRFTVAKDDKADYETVKDGVDILRDRAKDTLKRLGKRYCVKTMAEYADEMNRTYEPALLLKELVLKFDLIYKELKRKKNLLDFSDIEHYALDILSHEGAASEYRDKFKYIFIDEYQDSNLVQEAIISKIQRHDNLFMVGDVKQSIYKFRLAEPEIFIKKYELFRDSPGPSSMKLDLNRNFRSKGPIIDMVNHLFSRIMNKRSSGIEYDDDAALYKGVSYRGPLEHQVEFHLIDDKNIDDADIDDEIKAMKKAEIEALAAASHIKKARGMPFYDEKNKEERKLLYKDIVILLRSASGLADIYREALEQEGIPAYMDTGEGYFDTVEISVFLNLLKIIDNKKQDLPLISVMRSPIFGFTIEELALIRSEFRNGPYFKAMSSYAACGEDEFLRRKCEHTFSELSMWRKQAKFLPLPDFIWKMIQSTGYYDYIGALPGGVQRQANLRSLADKAMIYEDNSGRGLFGFINYVEAMKAKKISEAPVKLIGESDDVVRIMTVHKSKGLEYPMVLLGGLGRLFHREGGRTVSLHKDLGISIRQIDEGRCSYRQTILQKLIDDRVAREAIAEEIRILYVALTRGMDKLVLIGTARDAEELYERAQAGSTSGPVKGRCYLDFLLPGLEGNYNVRYCFHGRESMSIAKKETEGKKTVLRREMATGFSPEDSISNQVEGRLSWNYEYAAALLSKSKYSVSELYRTERRKRKAIGEAVLGRNTDRGNAYHTIMEHIQLDADDYSVSSIENFTESLAKREILSEEDISLVDLGKISRFLQSGLGERLRKSEKVYRETAFNLMQESGGEEIMVQGIIDCNFIEDDQLILIDFKSDYTDGSEKSIKALVDAYRPQLLLYKEALQQIRKIPVKEAYLYLFAIEKEVLL